MASVPPVIPLNLRSYRVVFPPYTSLGLSQNRDCSARTKKMPSPSDAAADWKASALSLHKENPEVTAREIADEVGQPVKAVKNFLSNARKKAPSRSGCSVDFAWRLYVSTRCQCYAASQTRPDQTRQDKTRQDKTRQSRRREQ